jgi:hypothetical protein
MVLTTEYAEKGNQCLSEGCDWLIALWGKMQAGLKSQNIPNLYRNIWNIIFE